MIEVLRTVEWYLHNENYLDQGIEVLKDKLNKESDKIKIFKIKSAIRLLIKYQQFVRNEASIMDLGISVRQFILFLKMKINLPKKVANELRGIEAKFGLIIDTDGEANATIKTPKWIKEKEYFSRAYELEQPGDYSFSVGDDMIQKLSNYSGYRSHAQKIAIYNALEMKGSSTILISLPTGSGKSLVGQLVSYLGDGLTVVVVPTVALAIDQLRSSIQLPGIRDSRRKPRAYYGGMKSEDKDILIRELSSNEVSILYISPEALVRGELGEVVLSIAESGLLDNLVIDEAHLIVDWGEFFRTEFQFLSIYRKKLLRFNVNLKTILLSATYSDNTVEVLENMFSENNNFIEVRADSLRKEPMYCVDSNNEEMTRKEHIVELVRLLPRPMILYVVTKKEAEEWKNVLCKQGFKNLEIFYGDTNTDERERIIKDWTEDRLDVIIATSAFGMGVDKPDIRTIIHACIPESPNRFYQEVGRGGRDGLNSISIISSYKYEDKKIANDLTKNRVLVPETIVNRWMSLYETRETMKPDEFWIDTNVKPKHISEKQITGLRNITWNEYVVLFLARHGFITLLDYQYRNEIRAYKIKIRINVNAIKIIDEQEFLNWVLSYREFERKLVKDGLEEMKKLVDRPFRKCWSDIFSDIYKFADANCNGCPYCNRHNKDVYISPSNLKEIRIGEKPFTEEDIIILNPIVGISRDLWFNTGESKVEEVTDQLSNLLNHLIKNNINRIILPDRIANNIDLKKILLCKIGGKIHYVLSKDEVLENINLNNSILLNGNFIIVYDSDDYESNKMFEISNKLLDYSNNNKIVHISKKNLYISDLNRNIDQIINGYSVDLCKYIKEEVDVI